MRMVTAEGRGYSNTKKGAGKLVDGTPDRRRVWMTVSYALLICGGFLGLHRLYNRQPIMAFAQALFSVYVLLEFGSWTSLYLAVLLVAWLVADGFAIPKWIARRAEAAA
jgi:TM2 domain-containing membrane protein YozV